MAYFVVTDPRALHVNLSDPYTPPADPAAVAFDFKKAGPAERKPPLFSTFRSRMADASVNAEKDADHYQEQAKGIDQRQREHNSDPARAIAIKGLGYPWSRVPVKDRAPSAQPWNKATPANNVPENASWQPLPWKDDEGRRHAWDKQRFLDIGEGQGFNDPDDHNVATDQSARDSVVGYQDQYESAATERAGPLDLGGLRYTSPQTPPVNFSWPEEGAGKKRIEPPTRALFGNPGPYSWDLKGVLDGRTIHPWDRKPRLGTEVEFPSAIEPDAPLGDPPEEPENKRTYLIMNASSLIEVTSNTPLEFKDLTIGLDADSFAWTMSCTILNRASMNLIRPTSEGPAEVIATINGHAWRFVVERYSLDRRFAREAYQVKGVSRSQLLAAPYAPKRTGRITTQTSATQAMTEQLQFTGFSVTRQQGLTDYVIPADAWGWDQKTAMEVVAELAAAQGAIVVPDRDTDELHIKHRYKLVGPWAYNDQPIEFVDAIVQDTMTISYASQWEPQPEYNSVFVSGITDGVAVDVIRQGTAGDKPAPDIFDDLNVEAYQCRERGMAAIAAGGNQEIVTLETVLPTSGSPGLIEPAMIVEFRDTQEPTSTWRGNVLSNSINVGKPGTGRVTQTIKIERHHYGNS